jgi:hypothetical protein
MVYVPLNPYRCTDRASMHWSACRSVYQDKLWLDQLDPLSGGVYQIGEV